VIFFILVFATTRRRNSMTEADFGICESMWKISGYDLATAGRMGALRSGFTVAEGAFSQRVPVCITAVAATPPTGVCDDPTSKFQDRG
jgi:hypothetical protein